MRVLVVENDTNLAGQLATALQSADYCVDVAFDGEEGQFLGETEPYDAVILDIGLPKVDGLTVLNHWRRIGQIIPVLVLTARRTWSEKVAGFDAGCDDYLTKPFHIEEMLARVRCLIRRAAGHAKPVLECGPMRLDTRTSRVSTAGEPVDLTANELKVFSYLIHHQDQVVSRSELIEHIYARDFDRDSNTIEVFIARLRKKLGADLIQTRKGLGYCLTVPEIVA
ncbi:MAG: response regulator transcription factor [Rhodospirillaceae bacterium]|nr:response regulator transcription factor [Rhodospirillaceae bacterium]MBT4589119.1 response regulator transcription factor [Rhodospirillaceae bacterium]